MVTLKETTGPPLIGTTSDCMICGLEIASNSFMIWSWTCELCTGIIFFVCIGFALPKFHLYHARPARLSFSFLPIPCPGSASCPEAYTMYDTPAVSLNMILSKKGITKALISLHVLQVGLRLCC